MCHRQIDPPYYSNESALSDVSCQTSTFFVSDSELMQVQAAKGKLLGMLGITRSGSVSQDT